MAGTVQQYYPTGSVWKRSGRTDVASSVAAAVPSADLPNWTFSYNEDFTRNAAIGSFGSVYGGSGSNGWNGYDNSLDTSKNGLYSPARVLSVANSMLDYYIHYDATVVHNNDAGSSQTGWPLVAAPLPTGKVTGQKYGRFKARFRSDVLAGYKMAFLLWPDSDNWTTGGEVDLPEGNLFGNDVIQGYVHKPGQPSINSLSANSSAIAADGAFHTTTIEWTPAGVTFFVDDVQIGTTTVVPPESMHWVLQVETQLGATDGNGKYYPPATNISGHVQVDWIAAWTYNASNANWVLGTTKPNASNTGLSVNGLTTADMTTVVNGDLVINDAYVTAHGTTFDKYWVKGFVVFTAATDCKFTNSQLEGRGGFTASTRTTNGVPTVSSIQPTAVIHARTATGGKISAENCKIFPTQPDINLTTVAGEALGHFYRCDVSLGSDQFDYWNNSNSGKGANIDLQGNFVHDYTVWANDNKHPTDSRYPYRSHNDGVQTSGCAAANIVGNFIDMHFSTAYGDYATVQSQNYPNGNWGAAIIITLTGGHATNVKIYNNWFKGGEQHGFFPFQSGGSYTAYQTGNDWECYGNRHAFDIHGWGPYSSLYAKEWYEVGDGEVNAAYGGNPALSCHDNIFDPNDPTCIAAGVAGNAIPGMVLINGDQWIAQTNYVNQT